jgi:hypothetical protein
MPIGKKVIKKKTKITAQDLDQYHTAAVSIQNPEQPPAKVDAMFQENTSKAGLKEKR